jgi:hypothetical protein
MEMLEWDARSYDALPLPHEHWGATAIALAWFQPECGHGNIETFRTALRKVSGADGGEIWIFADVQETTAHLQEAGFSDVNVRLVRSRDAGV